MNARLARPHERGVALAVALMLLVIISVLAVAGARATTGELRMAVNSELRVAAFQGAQSAVDAAIADPASTPVGGNVGDTTCTTARPGCTRAGIRLPAELAAQRGVDVTVRRLAPEQGPPPRGLQTSLASFGAAHFQIEGSYDALDEGLGRVRVNEGVIVLVPRH